MKIKMLVAAAAALSSVAVNAADFSFTGSFTSPDQVQFFDFAVGTASTVTVRSWSYAGGTNAAGTSIAQGGFDPILALFALPGGAKVGENDDGGCSLVAADSATGACWDTFFSAALTPGLYRVSVAVFPNFSSGGNLSDGFSGADSFNNRSNNWAFDVLNVDTAVQIGVPEPTSWAMLIAGFGLTGAALRRRRTTAVAA